MFNFLRRTPAPPWVYLGWSKIEYIDVNGKIEQRETIHFYARGEEMKERRFDYASKGNYDPWRHHPFVQQGVVPWSEGENLWNPIRHPSENLKDWTRGYCGFEWKDGRWYKPAEKIEGNVFKFPPRDDRQTKAN